MKLITFSPAPGVNRLGILLNDGSIADAKLAAAHFSKTNTLPISCLPDSMLDFLRLGEGAMDTARLVVEFANNSTGNSEWRFDSSSVEILSPVPYPTSMRDGYAFRQHVEAARRNRGVPMIAEYDEIPIFYFTNHQAVFGPGNIPVRTMHLDKLDFELECAVVIGKKGANISAKDADGYIAGYMVMNDWSARALQMKEMTLNLGPAKGKDFATSLGPWLVTKDELESRKIATPNGDKYDLTMRTTIDGEEISLGNLKDMTWTFAQIIERASYGVALFPGDVIGSGTCGTGCFLELNGSKVFDPPRWVKPGERVVCSIELLGDLENTVTLED